MDKKKKVGLAVLIIIALYVAASVSLFYRNKGEWIFLCIP